MERDEVHWQDIAVRKLEHERKKEIKSLQKIKLPISSELQISIFDLEAAWKADQEQLKDQLYE